jgi:basic membrane lipoprotein Med (substrate-binding protein (PBP1-ABC) superfamily)
MVKRNILSLLLVAMLVTALAVSCAPAAPEKVVETVVVEKEVEKVVEVEITAVPVEEGAKVWNIYATMATPAEEPWLSVITAAVEKLVEEGRATYAYTDDIGYAGDYERVLREVSESGKYDIITGDTFGNEEAARRVAKDFPNQVYVMGSGLGPVEPNFSVFDNWIHEPGYLLGMLAGGLTETNKVGVVAGYPVPEVNRITNAFVKGVKDYNPDATVYVQFINSWFDPPAAKEAAQAQIDAGVDVLYAERFGVIEAAAENGLWVFGQMTDQHELSPDYVVSSSVWNLTPTFDYVLSSLEAGVYSAQDLKDFSMMAKGGASLAPFYGLEDKIPDQLKADVKQKEADILAGVYRVDVDEGQPASVN